MEVLVASSDTDLHFEQPAAVRLKVTVVNLAHGVHVLVSDLLRHSPLIGQEELVEKPTNTGRSESVQTDDKQMGTLLVLSLCEALVARHFSTQELDVDDVCVSAAGTHHRLHRHLYFSSVFCGIW